MKTAKIALIGIAVFLLSGCGKYNKEAIELECVQGVTIVTMYKASFVGIDEDIRKPENRTQINNTVYVKNGKKFLCTGYEK